MEEREERSEGENQTGYEGKGSRDLLTIGLLKWCWAVSFPGLIVSNNLALNTYVDIKLSNISINLFLTPLHFPPGPILKPSSPPLPIHKPPQPVAHTTLPI